MSLSRIQIKFPTILQRAKVFCQYQCVIFASADDRSQHFIVKFCSNNQLSKKSSVGFASVAILDSLIKKNRHLNEIQIHRRLK